MSNVRHHNQASMESSSQGSIVSATGTAVGSSSASGTPSAHYAGTNRLIVGNPTFDRVQVLAHAELPSGLANVDTVEELRAAMADIGPPAEREIQAYRGRSPPFLGDIPTRNEMGPPPLSPTSECEGRYGVPRTSTLYLSESTDGVRRELLRSGDQIWIQRFVIPTAAVRLADLRGTEHSIQPLLNSVLWFTELSGEQGQPPLAFSQFFARLMAERFDGVLLPGVRGDADLQYWNLVLFRAQAEWRHWLADEEPWHL